MNRDCRKIAENLIDIVENNIPESLKKRIQEHLATCSRCNRLVKSFTRAWQELATSEKLTPSDRFWPELLAKIKDHEKPMPLRDKILAGLRNSLRPATVSLILLFGVFFGYQLGNVPRTETSRPEVLTVEHYLQDFQDFPDGSVSDFFTKYEISIQEEKP